MKLIIKNMEQKLLMNILNNHKLLINIFNSHKIEIIVNNNQICWKKEFKKLQPEVSKLEIIINEINQYIKF